MKNTRAGFTIVELLIVIVVIAILAAITIVSYNGITQQAYRATVDSEVSAMAKQLQLYHVNTSTYPIDDATLKPLVQKAGLWAPTHAGNEWTYLYCTDQKGFAIIPWNKQTDIHDVNGIQTGESWRVNIPQQGWFTIAYDPNADPVNTVSIAHDLCITVFPDRVWQRWFSSMS